MTAPAPDAMASLHARLRVAIAEDRQFAKGVNLNPLLDEVRALEACVKEQLARAEKAEADSAAAIAAHLNCHVVKQDLAKAEARLVAADVLIERVLSMAIMGDTDWFSAAQKYKRGSTALHPNTDEHRAKCGLCRGVITYDDEGYNGRDGWEGKK